MATKHIEGVLTADMVKDLRAGDTITYSGVIYTARDAAHKRLCEMLDRGEEPPFPIENAVIYYAGPAPAAPGEPIGPVGPTTSYRMDPYAPRLLDLGQRAMIGKGKRSDEVVDAVVRNGAIYFAAVGGAATLIGKCVADCTVVCFEDLGAEAVRRLVVVDMPLTVAIDSQGNNIYMIGPANYLASIK